MTIQRQVTYPKELVNKLNLKPGQKFYLSVVDEEENLTKHQSVKRFLDQIAGSIHVKAKKSFQPGKFKKLSFRKIRQLAHEEVAKKYR